MDGEYEEYELHSYPLDDSVTLRGLFKLDANNELYCDGDEYPSSGEVTHYWAEKVFDGSDDEGWMLSQYGYYQTGSISDAIDANASVDNIFCDKITYAPVQNMTTDKGICLIWRGVRVRNETMDTIDNWKTYLSTHPITVMYRLATPTTESADPYTNPQVVNDFGTEEYVIETLNDVVIPVGHDTMYNPNLRAKLEMAPNSPDGDGDYIVRQTNGENSYVQLVIPSELPTAPSSDGTYVLKCTVSSGVATLSWVSE